ncbi:UDP-glucose/GDP-mannose dehydrogenase family protein [Candidatus Pacearchaeota archaeon]|nr:UDP-glucose/GDP-mannose dehydrogenase family protein [Candidatus Pacearchaeota archaeon]
MKIGVVGVGIVGGATAEVLKNVHELFLYDRFKQEHNSPENLRNLVKNSDVIFICVPTPMKITGEIDYSDIHNSMDQLIEELIKIGRNPQDILIVIRSTAVSGATDKLAYKYPFRFAFNPEFLREKHAFDDMKNTDRIVIGANDERSTNQLRDIYKPLFPNAKYSTVTRKEAEMIKYAANVVLASQVTVANEIFQICKAVGVDYDIVKNAILLDKRIGSNIEVPGPDGDFGFGGKCFPKDLKALIRLAQEHEYDPYLLQEIWRTNERIRKNKDWLKIKGATSKNNYL